MPWLRLDDQFSTNTKILSAGKDGRELYFSALGHAARNLTDGFISADIVRQIAAMFEVYDAAPAIARLVEVRLWDVCDGGWMIHDYLQYNPSRDEVMAERAATAKRQAEWRAKQERNASGQYDQAPSNDVRNGVSNDVRNGVTNASCNTVPVPVPVPDPVPVLTTTTTTTRAREGVVQDNAPVQDSGAGGAGQCTPPVQVPAPKPSLNHHTKPSLLGASAPEPPKPARKPSRAPDPRSNSPAIRCARGVGGRYPPKEIWDDVIRILGESPDGGRLAEYRKTWVGRGYNPNNWNWLLEWYENGMTPIGRGGASPDPPPKPKPSGPVVILNPLTRKREVIGGNGNTAGREPTSTG